MSLRTRVTVLVAAAVAVAILAGSAATYLIVRDRLGNDVDGRLTGLARSAVQELPPAARSLLSGRSQARLNLVRKMLATLAPPARAKPTAGTATLGVVGYQQYVDRGGGVTPAGSPLPASLVAQAAAVAAGRQASFFIDLRLSGEHARVFTTRATDGLAVQTVLPLSDIDSALSDLRIALVIVSVCGIAVAAALAPPIARTILRPVVALTAAAERVSRTRDLGERIDAAAKGELGRLSQAFDRMLSALQDSSNAQRQLVADASHELRTPLASLLMNIDLLADGSRPLSKTDREHLIDDLAHEIRELGRLTNDLLDLARDEDITPQLEDLRLDMLVEETLVRARRHAPSQRFELNGDPCVVRGVAPQLERAISNLLDNAIKWSPPGMPIEVTVSKGTVLVRDHGPGIDEHDLPHIFERFYRAQRSRDLPGSGLGLAIARQVAHNHDGHVNASNAPDGGALLSLSIPTTGSETSASHDLLNGPPATVS